MKILKKHYLLIGIILLATSLRLVHLDQSFWLDEAAQVIESSRSFGEQFNIVADFHPPLFHVILHFWMLVSMSEIWIRLLSLIFSLGSIFGIYKLGKYFGTEKTGLFAAFFLSISPYHIWYSQEARPYMLFVFLSVISTYFLFKKNWAIYTILIVLNVYSLYFAPFLLISHLAYIFLFDRKYIKEIFISFLIAGMCFLPWFSHFINQIKTGTNGLFSGWTSVVSVRTGIAIPLTVFKFILGKMPLTNKIQSTILLAPEILLFLVSTIVVIKEKKGRILLSLFAIPLVVGLFVNAIVPIVAPQRFLFLLPIFVLIMSMFLEKSSRRIQIVTFAIIFFTSLVGIVQYYFNPYVQREHWKEAVSFIQQTETEASIIIFAFPSPFAPFIWYYKGHASSLGAAPNFRVNEENLNTLKKNISDKKKLYYFQYLSPLIDPSDSILKSIQKENFQEKIVKDFPGVGFVYLYEKI